MKECLGWKGLVGLRYFEKIQKCNFTVIYYGVSFYFWKPAKKQITHLIYSKLKLGGCNDKL